MPLWREWLQRWGVGVTAGTQRRVRVVIEGTAREVSNRCGVLRIDLPLDDSGLLPTVMVNPSWPGVTVEEVAPSYNWQDGDVVLRPLPEPQVWSRGHGRWLTPMGHGFRTDGEVQMNVTGTAGWTVLRYQAGEA